MSDVNSNLVAKILNFLKGDFRNLLRSKGRKHSFLGMNITIKDESRVEMDMKDQLEESFQIYGEELSEVVSTSEVKHPWNFNRCAK